jgi:D-alanine-D-alanine ligase
LKVLIVYNLPTEKSSADDMDVLNQVEAVKDSLIELQNTVEVFGIDLNLNLLQNKIEKYKPEIVFNLVEAINGVEMYLHFVPSMLEKLNVPFTGSNSEILYTTTNKILTKKLLNLYDIKTPFWSNNISDFETDKFNPPVIVKPNYADASVGLDDLSIVKVIGDLENVFNQKTKLYGECFIEQFIDGREFNISVIETEQGPLILPIAEIRFENYPENKSKIVNYDAKWNENSFEYKNTIRHFDFDKSDLVLLENLKDLTNSCWEKFELNGYVRIDYRVDKNNNIYVLEINANPCISPDSGFYAACEKYGWNYSKMVETIVKSV